MLNRGPERVAVDTDDAAARPDQLGRNLGPPAGPGAQIEDSLAGPQEALFLLDLEQFVRGPRAVALAFGAQVEGVFALVAGDAALRRRRC